MATARKVEETCPPCGDDDDVWVLDKREGTGIKKCYTCESCGSEWSKMTGCEYTNDR